MWEGESLLYVLRERLGLPGSKNACEQGECGSCSVYLDGELVCACLVLAAQAEGREVVTVEGIAGRGEASCTRCSEAFVEAGARAVRVLHARADRGRATTCCAATRARATPRSARRSPATCAGARATRRSSTRSGSPASAWPRRRTDDDAHRDRGLRDRDRRRGRDRVSRRRTSWSRATGSPRSATGAAPGSRPAGQRIDGRGRLATPGLVNCHHHLYQWATRGLAQQATLFEWLIELYPVWALIDDEIVLGGGARRSGGARASGCSTSTDHHYVFPRDAGDLLAGRDRRRRGDRPALPPVPRLDGSRALGRRAAARRGRRGPRRDPGRERGRDRPLPRPVAGRDGADRARALLAVLGDARADDRGRRARAPPRRAPAHAPRRDARRGAVLPGALRRAPGRLPRRARLARRRRLARALRAPQRRRDRPLRRHRHRGRALPELERAARRGDRAGRATCSAPARRSASASTAPPRTRTAGWRRRCARRC